MADSKKGSSGILSVFSLIFVTSSLAFFILKSLFITGWTSEHSSTSPLRWVSATVIPVMVATWGHSRKSLSTSGALFAVAVGFCLTLAHYSFFLCLLAFFISSSKATKFKQEIKRKVEDDFKEGGQRNWQQVLCNGGMATQLSLLYMLDVGSADLPVDFRHQYRASWLGVAVLGAVSCCNGDTWASELGTVLSQEDPFLITTLRKVPTGTNGAVSMAGLVASLAGGLLIGLAYYLGVQMSASSNDLEIAPSQLLVILVGGLGGLIGSIIDSLLGASLQFSGKDQKTGKIVEVIRDGVVPISGKMVFDNHSVNLISSIVTALVLPKVAMALGM